MPDGIGVAQGERLLAAVVDFSVELRSAGLRFGIGQVMDFVRTLSIVDLGDRSQVHAAGAALFCRTREDLTRYDEVFDRFWSGAVARPGPVIGPPRAPGRSAPRPERRPDAPAPGADGRPGPPSTTEPRPGEDRAGDDEPGISIVRRTYSRDEALRRREFERMTEAELLETARLIDRLEPHLELQRSRRSEIHPRGRTLAPRQMFRSNLTTGDELFEWLWRRPMLRPRPVCIICDISGSMELHARLLLRFARGLIRARARTEAFVFATRLTRITRQLRERDPDQALHRVSREVVDWSGGTRIGDAFRTFNRRWAGRIVPTSSVMIVVSDGWDRGEPAVVAEETARLRRNCHRLIWLNPVAGSTGYEPLAAGMAAALPYVDHFLPAGSLADLERVGTLLARDRVRRRTSTDVAA